MTSSLPPIPQEQRYPFGRCGGLLVQRHPGRRFGVGPGRLARIIHRRVGLGRASDWWAVASRFTPRQTGPLPPTPAQRPTAHRHFGLLVPPYHAMNSPGSSKIACSYQMYARLALQRLGRLAQLGEELGPGEVLVRTVGCVLLDDHRSGCGVPRSSFAIHGNGLQVGQRWDMQDHS